MSQFGQLARTFLDETYADSPVFASQLGLDGYDDRLDDLSEAAFADRRRRSAAWLERFAGLDPATACGSFDERIDRALLLSVLRGRAVLDDWEMWRRQPETYLNPGLSGLFTLFLHRLKPEPDLVRAAVARLRAIPRLIQDGQRNVRPELAPAIYIDRALRQARSGARYLRELVPNEVQDETLRARVAEAGATAAAAFDDFAAFLADLQPRASGEWAIGRERYSRLLREKELLGDDADTLRARGQREYDRFAAELRRCAVEIDGTEDWPAVLARLNKDHPPTPEAMRQTYAEWTERARQFLKEHALVTFPAGESCEVVPSPPFQRPVLAVASYQAPPPFSALLKGHFFVPFPPDGASEAEIQQRLESNNYSGIPTTAVHEAYPGHHWHLVVMKGHPSPVRRSFRTPYFTEGWGLYAEQMMREQGFFADPRHEMFQYEAMLFRAARIVVDTSLHLGEMSVPQAVDFMMTRANMPEPTARAEVARYCAWPTQASAYLTGCLEILRLRERYLAVPGASLRGFHDLLAGSGALPIALAEDVLLTESSRPA
jgi:uncharacterized protein (DUF885 family)